VETAGQLTDEFRDVARAACTLAMLPPEGVGPVSVGLSKLAARLKVQLASTQMMMLRLARRSAVRWQHVLHM